VLRIARSPALIKTTMTDPSPTLDPLPTSVYSHAGHALAQLPLLSAKITLRLRFYLQQESARADPNAAKLSPATLFAFASPFDGLEDEGHHEIEIEGARLALR